MIHGFHEVYFFVAHRVWTTTTEALSSNPGVGGLYGRNWQRGGGWGERGKEGEQHRDFVTLVMIGGMRSGDWCHA